MDEKYTDNARGVIDSYAYAEDHGRSEVRTPGAVGAGGTKTPDPKPSVEPSREEEVERYREEVRRLEQRQRQLQQRETSRGPLDHLAAAIRKCFR